MQALQIDETKARSLYKSASDEFKTMLEDTFGENFFSSKVTDRVKTFFDACTETDMDPYYQAFTAGSTDDNAYQKLKVIARALNEGWKPDWNDGNQAKWYPWFYMNKPGFRFADSVYDYSHSYSAGGSRLCFKSRELAEYAGKQFMDIYEEFLK